MAILDACKYEVKELMEKATKKGKSQREAAEEIAEWFKTTVGVDIKPNTVRSKAQRAKKKEVDANASIPTCSTCEKRKVMHRGDVILGDGDLCQPCRSAEVKRIREHKEGIAKGVKKTEVTREAEAFWQDVVSDVEKQLNRTGKLIHKAVGPEVLRKVLNMRDQLNSRIDELGNQQGW